MATINRPNQDRSKAGRRALRRDRVESAAQRALANGSMLPYSGRSTKEIAARLEAGIRPCMRCGRNFKPSMPHHATCPACWL